MEPKLESTPRLRFTYEDNEPYPEWEEKKLGEVAKMYQPKTISSSDLDTEGYPVYGAGGVIGYYREYNHEDSEVIMVCRGAGVGQVRFTLPKSWITGNSMVISPLSVDNLAKSYLRFCLSTIDPKVISDGSAQPQITRRGIQNLPIPLPSLSEQEKIGEFLSALDDEVEQAERLVSLLSDRKRAYAHSIFNRTLRFHDDNDNPYPEWEEKKLGEMSDFVNGYAFKSSEYTPNGKYKVVTIKNVTGDTAVQTESCDRLDKLPPNLSPSHRLKIGDILISLTGNVGRVSTVFEENLLLNQRVGLIIPHHNVAKPFILAYLRDRILSHLESQSQGGAQKNISKGNIVNLPIPLPSLPEQEKIGSFLSSLDDEIDEAKRELGLLKERKKAYAQKIFGV